jgi:hypothetical protein
VTGPPDASLDCQAAIERLVGCHESGARPGDDAVLAHHLGSCLGCFRAAADLRDVPRLAALLREPTDGAGAGGPTAGDPGPAFWASLPGQLGADFERGRAPARAGATIAAPDLQGRDVWQRFVRWIRLPVPAAMAGAACATAVALLMTRPPALNTLAPRAVTTLDEDGAAAEGSLLGQEDVAFGQSSSVYDSVEELDSGALARVRDSFGNAVEQALQPHAQLAADDDDPGVGATATAPNPATVSDDLDQLDEQGLRALQAQLSSGR